MKRTSTVAACLLAALAAGCATSPVNYSATLSQQDPKWQSPQCQQARLEASDYEAREKKQMGWGTGLLFGPYGVALMAAVKEHQAKQRKLFARKVHTQCSSLPLPKDLEIDESAQADPASRAKYP
jgi:hypothetical protein